MLEMNPENTYTRKPHPDTSFDFDTLHKIPKNLMSEMHPAYISGYEKAKRIRSGKRISMQEFNNADKNKDITDVKAKLKSIEAGYSTPRDGGIEAMVQAEILEAFIFDMIANHKWFGNTCSAVLSSIYDDLFLGNDLILAVKMDTATNYSGVGIDITLGEISLVEKFKKTIEFLKQNKLGKSKYFISPDGRFKGELNGLPHFVIGVDRENLFPLIKSWVDGDYKTLKESPVRKNLLKMMILQCDEFSKYGDETIVRPVYQNEKIILQRLLESLN
jgi:hypothetical protein